jgi:hypothetical protein
MGEAQYKQRGRPLTLQKRRRVFYPTLRSRSLIDNLIVVLLLRSCTSLLAPVAQMVFLVLKKRDEPNIP